MVEIIVSVAILSVLAILILSVTGRARAMAAKAGCVSNLKRFSAGVQQYVADTGHLLPAKEWIPLPEGGAVGGGP
ncbi:MAG: hypothetical protein ACK5NG_00710, partial [Chthoniobacterales bacterium]